MKNLLLISLLALIMSSCAFHAGMMTGNASITDNNFRVVKIIDGQAFTTHILGIGGLSKSALVLEAKKNMLKNHPLRKGQALANVTVDVKKTFVLIYVKTLITVSADVIDFNPEDSDNEFDEIMPQYYKGKTINIRSDINVGDSVYYISYGILKKGRVDALGKSSAKIVFLLKDGTDWRSTFSYESILRMNKLETDSNNYGFEIGQKVEFILDNGDIKQGTIFGLNYKNAGIRYDYNDKDGSIQWALIPYGRVRSL